MRYQCRVANTPASFDVKYPGTYNARIDNLEGFWKPLFGHSHGILVASVFYENVSKAKMDGRELAEGEKAENVILEFKPNPAHDMLVACLWSRWTSPGEPDLLSFAAITDDPPPKRCRQCRRNNWIPFAKERRIAKQIIRLNMLMLRPPLMRDMQYRCSIYGQNQTCNPLSKYSRSSGECKRVSHVQTVKDDPFGRRTEQINTSVMNFTAGDNAHQERNRCSMSATSMHSAPMLKILAVSRSRTRSYRFSNSGLKSLLRRVESDAVLSSGYVEFLSVLGAGRIGISIRARMLSRSGRKSG
jgi:hypothetical protein